MSNKRPKRFCDETCWTGSLLKKIGGCITFFTLRVKITSCPCLERSGLKLVFHWKAHSFVLSKFAQSCLAAAFGSLIIVNKKRSSAESFGFDWRFSVRSFKSRGPRTEPCATLHFPQKYKLLSGPNNKGDWNNWRNWKIFRWKIIGLHGINKVGGIFAWNK